jgi:hypothetical protein
MSSASGPARRAPARRTQREQFVARTADFGVPRESGGVPELFGVGFELGRNLRPLDLERRDVGQLQRELDVAERAAALDDMAHDLGVADRRRRRRGAGRDGKQDEKSRVECAQGTGMHRNSAEKGAKTGGDDAPPTQRTRSDGSDAQRQRARATGWREVVRIERAARDQHRRGAGR